jgi:NAD(P)-dependent dehydrogenase (short-subunit alcohol dehydrogenase family)
VASFTAVGPDLQSSYRKTESHRPPRQVRKKTLEDVSDEEFDLTFKTNVYAYFRLARATQRAMAVTLVSNDVAKRVTERAIECAVRMIVVVGNAFVRKMSRRFCRV